MINRNFNLYSSQKVEKIGNTIIYLSNGISNLSKTKLLKLLYILDELSIKKRGVPFLGLDYKLWKLGPVNQDIFNNLSSDNLLLKNYINTTSEDGIITIEPIKNFNDDEFSDFEIELMDNIIANFGNKTAKELVLYTHRKNSPWYITAVKNDLLENLERETISYTDISIDMSLLVAHDESKLIRFNHFISEC